MRILIVHNYYGRSGPSGENTVVDAETSMLRDFGHEVEVFARHSDSIRDRGVLGAIQGGFSVAWNPLAVSALIRQVRNFRPAIVHVHNTFPLISPAIFRALRHYSTRVMTLHNYRVFCAQGLFSRAGHVCMDCYTRRSVLPGVRHRCYRGSFAATLPLAAGISLHRALGTWKHEVDAFIALTDFQRRLFAGGGLPESRIHVKGNFFGGTAPAVAWTDRSPGVAYVGRIVEQKGVGLLVQAWLRWGRDAPPLRIIGDGPLLPELRAAVSEARAENVEFLGITSAQQVLDIIAESWLVVMPSIGVEGFPMVIPEAFACGTPVAVSSSDPLPTVIRPGVNGIVFEAGSADALVASLQKVWASPTVLEGMGLSAHATFLELYTPAANHSQLMDIYQRAIAARGSQGGAPLPVDIHVE